MGALCTPALMCLKFSPHKTFLYRDVATYSVANNRFCEYMSKIVMFRVRNDLRAFDFPQSIKSFLVLFLEKEHLFYQLSNIPLAHSTKERGGGELREADLCFTVFGAVKNKGFWNFVRGGFRSFLFIRFRQELSCDG